MDKRKGFTLVELLIVVAILLVLAMIMVAGFNPVGIYNKARDAQRKKDLARIKVAFEEYYNDKGCYPNNTLTTQLTSKANCGTKVFSPWLSVWLCDPNGNPYQIAIDNIKDDGCPKWFKILAELENKTDSNIPPGWTTKATQQLPIGGNSTAATANYGVSSSNVNWSDFALNPECGYYGGCYYKPDPVDKPNECNSAGTGCRGSNCYIGTCKSICKVSCCGAGCE